MDHLTKDLRYALRMLRKSPVVTGAALLSLALGIGANTTIFTLFNAILLKNLPVAEPESLMRIYTREDKQSFGQYMPISKPNYESVRDETEFFDEVVGIWFAPTNLVAEGGDPEQIFGAAVTSNYFSTLGIEAAHGRVFVDEGNDEVLGSEPWVVLSHTFWSNRFGADPGVIGRTIMLNGHAFDVIGVTPPGFNGIFALGGAAFWAPVSMNEPLITGFTRTYWDDRRALISLAFGRLKDGVTLEQGNAVLATLGQGLREEYPENNKDRSFVIASLAESTFGTPAQRGGFVTAGWVLMGVVGLVLLIACANVANLLLGRAASRRREIGVRLALGASRSSLVQQLLTESLVMSFTAGALGLAVAYWARDLLWANRPPFLAQAPIDLSFEPTVFGFTLLVSLVTGILFGLAPAVQSSSPKLVRSLTQSSDSAAGAGRVFSFRNILVLGQVTLSLIALIGSGLFLKSLGSAMQVDLGYEPEKIFSMGFNLDQAGYDPANGEAFYDRMLERVRGISGVESAALTAFVPMSGGGAQRTVIVEGRPADDPNNRILVPVNSMDQEYLSTVGIRLMGGRDFTSADREGSQLVALANEAMAAKFWPGENALGQRFHFYGQDDQVREIIGIVETTKLATVGEDPAPQVYIPRKQDYQGPMSLAVRAPAEILGLVREEVQELDRNLPINNVQTGTAAIEQSLWAAQMGAWLLGILGGLALLLAAIGIYGVTAYTVAQRSRELSVRMALGADRSAVLRLVLVQGFRVVGIGIVLGLGVAALIGSKVEQLLVGVSGTDVPTFALTAGILALVAFAANLFPALRATGINPVEALRFER